MFLITALHGRSRRSAHPDLPFENDLTAAVKPDGSFTLAGAKDEDCAALRGRNLCLQMVS